MAVILDADSGELPSARLAADTAKVADFLAELPGPTRAAGVGWMVAASGKIERPARDKLTTISGTPSGCCDC